MTEVIQQLSRIVGMAGHIADQLHSGSRVPFETFDLVDEFDGFGLSVGHGAGLLYGNVTDVAPDSWSLQFTAAVAFDVPSRPEIGMWVNEKNRTTAFGKYYYAVNRELGLHAVMWEMFAWSRLLNDFNGMHGQGVIQWLMEIIRACLDASSQDADEFTRHFGGRILQPIEKDLMVLFTASSG
ncbi:hypothetical protein [Frankia sp. Cr2]|uniref:hypothetical protein n=1 Tax=Frankia sp. Cr2 TaxID=3073932 RepID=UPI002AD2B96B|nr:hypothetical protein [Frankia sp. Cr2]